MSNNRTPLEVSLASVIEEARLDLDLSQETLAERASVHLPAEDPLTQTTLSRMTRGKVPLRVDRCEAIAAALGMSFSALIQLAEHGAPRTVQAQPITETDGPRSNGARRRKPRRVITGRLEA